MKLFATIATFSCAALSFCQTTRYEIEIIPLPDSAIEGTGFAQGINDHGDVVGGYTEVYTSWDSMDYTRGFVWHGEGPGVQYGFGAERGQFLCDINDNGDMVGTGRMWTTQSSGVGSAYLISASGGVYRFLTGYFDVAETWDTTGRGVSVNSVGYAIGTSDTLSRLYSRSQGTVMNSPKIYGGAGKYVSYQISAASGQYGVKDLQTGEVRSRDGVGVIDAEGSIYKTNGTSTNFTGLTRVTWDGQVQSWTFPSTLGSFSDLVSNGHGGFIARRLATGYRYTFDFHTAPLQVELQGAGGGWSIYKINDMNASGQLAATLTKNGVRYAARLTPVPEPETLLLLSSGVIFFAIKKRRNR